MSAGGPVAVLFGHELAQAANRRGQGSALVVDTSGGKVDTLHLHLTSGAAGTSAASAVRLDWEFGDVEGMSVPASDLALLRIDDQQTPVRARCTLRYGHETLDVDVQVVETGSASFTRNTPILESDALARKKVLCIGLGSGGSAVADQLARSGVGNLVLWDRDRIEPHNVGRHVDCVVAGTDNNASRFAINAAAVGERKPAYYGRAYTRACGGDVVQVLPGVDDPCYACHAEKRIVQEEVSSTRDADRLAYADRPVPIEPGLTVDIQPIANMAHA